MNKKTVIAVLILFFLIFSMSGCLDSLPFSDGSVTYEAHPTKIQYTIQYGYIVNCSGSGEHEVEYNCSLPEVLRGTLIYDLLYKSDYENIILVNNTSIRWNISGVGNNKYKLGIVANITVESFLVGDLNGEGALTLEEIQTLHPDVVDKYCQDQIDSGLAYLESNNIFIKLSAQAVLNQVDSNNSFLVAKGLFQWLKQNTNYQTHSEDNSVQPALTTYQRQTGDCDDLSFLYISLCRSVSIPARLISGFLVKGNNSFPSAVRHAWVEVFVGRNITDDGWIPVECAGTADDGETEINQNFGVEDVGHLRLFKDDGSNESLNISISPALRAYSYNPDMNIDIKQFVEIDEYRVLESKELFIDGNGDRAYK